MPSTGQLTDVVVTMMCQIRKPSFEILVLCLAVFAVAAAVAWVVFEAMPHLEDEHANLYQAKVFARGRVTNPLPSVPGAFFVPYVIDHDDHRFAKYPPGYPLLLALGVLAGQPWLVNAMAAALAILGVYLLGRDLFDRGTGLLAAVLGAVSPMLLMLSGTLLSHPTSLAVLTFFAWAFVRARRPEEARRNAFAWAAGALGGLALAIRPWTALGIGLAFMIVALVDLSRKRGPAVAIYGRMAVAFVAIGSVWPLYNLIATGSALTNPYTMVWAYDRPGFGPEIGSRGYDWSDAMRNLKLGLAQFDDGLAGWPAVWRFPLVWLAVALGILLPPRRLVEPLLLVPPALLVAAHLLFWASSAGPFGPRYYAEGMPFLWLLAARGLLKLCAWRPGRVAVKVALPLCTAWSIIYVTAPRALATRGLYDTTREDAQRIISAGMHRALVFVKSDYWIDYANLSWLNAADLEKSDIIIAKDLGPATNRRVADSYPDREVHYYDRHMPVPFAAPVASSQAATEGRP